MKNSVTLPENYHEILQVDLQHDKKLVWLINGTALVITFVMFAAGDRIVPFSAFLGKGIFVRLGVVLVGYVLYIILHELVHGICMHFLSGQRPHYGFTGLYAYAASDVFYNKKSYIFIALAPVVVWGAVLAVLCSIASPAWFWAAYLIQVGNLSGAAGDYYVTLRFMRLPKEILVIDSGAEMKVYAPAE